ncbi:MAG: hypothetical protein F8N36_14450 [Desulfovibrio sp.]|uniref:hypothetical protein n=1 Tax=Desulfovibrio sp. TaxID=885 RepID=UPI00135D4194|nr:hypothetical protein [Desulfovibrio sp.]MTJ94039.1 hypothetical protein [Desulfovibrio sp.]
MAKAQDIAPSSRTAGDATDQVAWLDKYIAQQAAYYGLTIERFSSSMTSLAEMGKRIERGEFPDLF